MVCVLALSMIFAFSACRNDDTEQGKNSTTTSTTEKENPTENENPTEDKSSESDKTTEAADESLTGEWFGEETLSPQAFYAEYYNSDITKTGAKLRTTYKFNDDGTFSIGISISNISEVRKEYRSLMVAAARKNFEAQGKFLTTDDVLYYEGYADKVLESICAEQNGTYTTDGDMLVLTLNGETHSEKYAISGNKLTLKGSSSSDEPITLTRK